jgi:hypothetical protein
MTTQYLTLTDNARRRGPMGSIAIGALALVLGGLTACGQGGQQDRMQYQQDQGAQPQDRQQGR